MRRGPGWEVEAARRERRTLRLAAGAVPLTVPERRLLEFLVDKFANGAAFEDLHQACGYPVRHPLRVVLQRLIHSGHVVESVANGFAITPAGSAALRWTGPPAEDPAGRHGDLPPDVIPVGRSVVVPAVMLMLGEANWHLPATPRC